MIRIAVPAILLGLTACASAPESAPETAYVGTARMMADLTIEQQVVARDGARGLGEARIVIRPGDPAWRETFELVGGLRPGEMKALPARRG